MNRIITLTTDFGYRDSYVGAMKGVLYSLAPEVTLVDISHELSPQDVMEAAFVMRNACPYYPAGTVHLAVVDPGVGSERHAIALRKGDHWYVGPDNGLFSLLLNNEPPDEVVVLNNEAIWLTSDASETFHGRDIFAPAAAHLANGKPIDALGSPINQLKPLHWALPIADDQGVQGFVLHVDAFGNCITNISRDLLEDQRRGRPTKCYVGSSILDSLHQHYAQASAGEPIMLFGSSDLLEIAVNTGNASELLSIRKGSPVNIVFVDDRS